MTQPDVTVILAVYNTMPYLTRCMDSLVTQSIGRGRLEIIAVDDGSTDGSSRELERFARLYPDMVRVLHQPNSGGPAAPSNRGLDHATGRYVFFIGADDYLGREALERLVDAADRYGSDVVLGKTVGVNSRYIHQAVFASTQPEIDLFDSALPWSLSNTKLFRRELIEKFGLRYPEDMPVGSDQPLTIEACYRARRISVLADYDYYYAVRRLNARNITYHSRHLERLRCAEELIDFVAGLIEPGERRDAVLVRHFTWEVARLLENDFLGLERETQQRVAAGVQRLTRQYLTDRIRDQLPIEIRVRLGMAQYGELADLLAVIRQDAQGAVPPVIAEEDHWYVDYRGFRDSRLGMSDRWFEITESVADWYAKLDTIWLTWENGPNGRGLVVTARSSHPDLVQNLSGPVMLWAGRIRGTTLDTVSDEAGTTVRAHFPLRDLLADIRPGGELKIVRTKVTAFGRSGSAPLRGPRPPLTQRAVHRRGKGLYLITTTTSHRGQLVIAVAPVTPRRVLARLRRRLPIGGK